MMRSGTETEIPQRLEKAGKKAGDSKRMGKKSAKKTGKKSNGMTQKGGKPGKKAVIPMKGATIFARKKGTDLWYRYTFVGKGKKNTKENLKNPQLNVQTEKGKGIGFKENDIEWLYGTNDSALISIKNSVEYDSQIPADANILTDDKIGEAYLTFVPRKYWNS